MLHIIDPNADVLHIMDHNADTCYTSLISETSFGRMMHGGVNTCVGMLNLLKLYSVQSEGFESLSGSYTSLDNPEQFESKRMLKRPWRRGYACECVREEGGEV